MRFRPNAVRSSRSLHEDEGRVSWRPQFFDPSRRDHQRSVMDLIRCGALVSNRNAISRQICELMVCRDPNIKDAEEEQLRRAASHMGGKSTDEYGVWAYYPWTHSLVQILPQQEFYEVRNNRNHYKITQDEEEILATRRVGIVGLSVGHAIAQVMAMEGCATEYRLADPDTIALSNLNRLPCSIGDIGTNKAVLAARRMLEFDPFLTITAFPEGIAEEMLDSFILEGGKLDLLIEECDDLYMKVLVRERARALRVPVIMETNDRGMLDIERFDLEPERPIFHGMLGDIRAENLKGLSVREKVPFVSKILGGTLMSQRLAASLVEIDRTIVSWPQLGSGAILGGGTAGDTARRILTGELNTSGRFYVDIHEIVSDRPMTPATPEDIEETTNSRLESNQQTTTIAKSPGFTTQSGPSEDLVHRMVAAGTLAPSGGNVQPWKFVWTQASRLKCMLDVSRSESFLDFQRHAAYLSIGAAVENIRLTALDAGYSVTIHPFPQNHHHWVCEISFDSAPGVTSHADRLLTRAIQHRTTNRRTGPRFPIDQADYDALINASSSRGAQLHLLTKSEELSEIAAILGEADQFRIFCEPLFREMMSEMRWNSQEAMETRDGIDIATLDLREVDEVGLRLLSSWKVVKFLKRLGAGSALQDLSRKSVQSASAVALLTRKGVGIESFFLGGQAMESVWLTATARGLAIQPMSTLPYIFTRLRSGSGFTDDETKTLTALRQRYLGLFGVGDDDAELLLFRIAKIEPPAVRSLRRPVEEVLSFE